MPDPIATAASEAYACYSIRSYRAAILMARAVIEAVAKQQGHSGGSLAQKIDALEEARVIKPLTRDTAHEIRYLGNQMAHGDYVNEVSEEDADDVLNFMVTLLEEVYQQPARLTRFKDRRGER